MVSLTIFCLAKVGSESCRIASCWQRSVSQMTVALPLSAALMLRSFRFLSFMRAVHSSLKRLESLLCCLLLPLHQGLPDHYLYLAITITLPSGVELR